MNDWTEGYVTDVGYTAGYYRELNPLTVQLSLLTAGLVPPDVRTACELGFGQGVSVNVHAAASGTRWWGTDFNPSQAAFAQEMASAAGAGAAPLLSDEAFADFARREDLPPMDFIGLHGIWSWISDENRAVIVDFVRRKLKVGGVLYVSYNTQPGWAAMVPMRDLLAGYAEVMGAPGQGIIGRVDAALAFADRLIATNPAYARANPLIVDRVKKLGEQNRNYLAHEYFNRDWQPMTFAAMHRWMEPAKLTYGCSAHPFDQVDVMNLSTEQQELVNGIPDPVLRQTVVDFCVNRQFRKDYWIKGPRRLGATEQMARLRAQRVVLAARGADVTLTAAGAQGDVSLNEAVYRPVLEQLGEHRPVLIGELADRLQPKGVNFAQLLQALTVLTGKGAVTAAQDDDEASRARPAVTRLNRYLMDATAAGEQLAFLASPVTGGAVPVPRLEQLFLLAVAEGRQSPEEWAQSAWQHLQAQGQRLLKAGAPLQTPEENHRELLGQAREFAEGRLPVLQRLQVA